jgi:hypothetical protein
MRRLLQTMRIIFLSQLMKANITRVRQLLYLVHYFITLLLQAR